MKGHSTGDAGRNPAGVPAYEPPAGRSPIGTIHVRPPVRSQAPEELAATQSLDGAAWGRAFLATVARVAAAGGQLDEAFATAWFANAIQGAIERTKNEHAPEASAAAARLDALDDTQKGTGPGGPTATLALGDDAIEFALRATVHVPPHAQALDAPPGLDLARVIADGLNEPNGICFEDLVGRLHQLRQHFVVDPLAVRVELDRLHG